MPNALKSSVPKIRTKVRLGAVAPLVLGSVGFGFSGLAATPAQATGTIAGTTITNTATATYTDAGGNPVSVPSNKVDLKVDEIINVKVVSADPGDVNAPAGGTNQILSFIVTNTGNGSEAFKLSPVNAIGNDAFDPSTTSLVLDNGDGIYNSTSDTVYTGSNNPVLTADSSIRVFVLSTIPGTATNGQRGQTDLTATAVTGDGTPGKIYPGLGDGGSDAVIGTSTGIGQDKGFYVVSAVAVSFVKSATVSDPFGGTKSVPGSVITYTLVATVTGTGGLTNLAVGDPIPAATTYAPNSLTLEGTALSDATDPDAGEFTGTAIAARLGTVAGGQSRSVTFKTKIN